MKGSKFRLIFGNNFYSEVATTEELTLAEFIAGLGDKKWFVSGDGSSAIQISQIVTVEKLS